MGDGCIPPINFQLCCLTLHHKNRMSHQKKTEWPHRIAITIPPYPYIISIYPYIQYIHHMEYDYGNPMTMEFHHMTIEFKFSYIIFHSHWISTYPHHMKPSLCWLNPHHFSPGWAELRRPTTSCEVGKSDQSMLCVYIHNV